MFFLLQKEDNSWKYLHQLLLTSYFILVCLNETVYSLYYYSMVGTDTFNEEYNDFKLMEYSIRLLR